MLSFALIYVSNNIFNRIFEYIFVWFLPKPGIFIWHIFDLEVGKGLDY